MSRFILQRTLLVAASVVLIGVLALAVERVRAMDASPVAPSPFHPTFALLDAHGRTVVTSGQPLSPAQTCGQCHDTAYIAAHSFHADLGYSAQVPAGTYPGGRAWDTGPGLFGTWNPLTYRYLSPAGDTRPDLDVRAWVQVHGARLVGGGPAEEATGLELNCFLCHFAAPDNAARTAAIAAGEFEWANSAVLVQAGVLARSGTHFVWNAAAFDAQGALRPEFVTIQDPTNENCAQCHGVVYDGTAPLNSPMRTLADWQTATTGQIVSPQKIALSGLNLSNKAALTRAWDVHAERGLQCVDCHYALNNPALVQSEAKEAFKNNLSTFSVECAA